MQANPKTLRCSDATCKVCELNSKLIDNGAEAVSLSELEENACRIDVHPTDAHRCLYGLRLDLEKAEYRYISKSQDTRMCDFAILAISGDVAQLVAIELKSGAAYAGDIEQLKQGFRILHEYFEENGLTPQPTAYFVVGRDIDKLSYALRDRLASLRFGSKRVKLTILECGDSLHL